MMPKIPEKKDVVKSDKSDTPDLSKVGASTTDAVKTYGEKQVASLDKVNNNLESLLGSFKDFFDKAKAEKPSNTQVAQQFNATVHKGAPDIKSAPISVLKAQVA